MRRYIAVPRGRGITDVVDLWTIEVYGHKRVYRADSFRNAQNVADKLNEGAVTPETLPA